MGLLPTLNTRSNGATITAASFNSDFSAIKTWADAYVVLTDTAKTISVTHTWSASQSFNAGATFGAAVTVSTGGLTVTAGGLTVTAGGITVTAGGVTVAADGIAVTGASTFADGLTVTGTVAATAFSGDGSALTNLPPPSASDIVTGTLDNARLPTTISRNVIAGADVQAGTLSVTGDAVIGSDIHFTAVDSNLFSANTNAVALIESGASTIDDHDFVLAGILSSDQSRYVKLITVAGEEWYVRIDRKTL